MRRMIFLILLVALIGCAPKHTKLLSLSAVSSKGVPSSYPIAEEIAVVPGEEMALVFNQAVSTKVLSEIVFSRDVDTKIDGNKVMFVMPEHDLLIILPESIVSEHRQIYLKLWDVWVAKAEPERLYPCTGLHTITAFLSAYPDIKLYNEGGILVRVNDEVTFQAGCPLDKALVSEEIQSYWSDVDYRLTWIDDTTFTFSIAEPEWRKLEIRLTDHGGRLFHDGLFVWFEFVVPSVVKAIDLGTGHCESIPVPVGIARAESMNNDFTQAILGRPIPIYGYNHKTRWATVSFDLQTQQIVRVAEDWLKDEYVHQALDFLGKIQGSKPYYVGMSHSKQLAAALQLELDGKSQVIIARSSGEVERYPSKIVVDQMELEMHVGHPTDPTRLYWSSDDSLVFYSYFGSCYRFDTKTGQETMLRDNGTIIASSPLSQILIAVRSNSQKNNYYLLDYTGKETWFAEGASKLNVLCWTHPDRFIYSLEDKCFVYDISAVHTTLISTGVAFDYDALTNRVFVHDRVK